MTEKKEYIEREAVFRALYDHEFQTFLPLDEVNDVIDDIPAADVVEVVRCKDCIYYEANCCFNSQWDMESSPEVPMVCENDFCSQGERKEQG